MAVRAWKASGMNPLTLLVTVAHPDDESFGCGSVIALAAARGWRVVVCCASRGEAGADVSGRERAGAALADAREAELRAAATILGVDLVEILGLRDSGWDGPAPDDSLVGAPERLHAAVADALTRHRPSIVVTMDPNGSDSHRDHAAIGRATTEVFGDVVDWPASLYHWCLPRSLMNRWVQETAPNNPDNVYLEAELGRADEDVTTVLDARPVLERRRQAIAAHATQACPYASVSSGLAEAFLSHEHLIRISPPLARWRARIQPLPAHGPAGFRALDTGHVAAPAPRRPGHPANAVTRKTMACSLV